MSMARLWCAWCVVCTLVCGVHGVPVNITTNDNNVFGRAQLKADSGSIKYLGDKESTQECAQACEQYNKNGDVCRSFTYHLASFGAPWAKGCYGETDWTWVPHSQPNVNSGKVGTWPTPGKCVTEFQCNYNGKCVNGTCQCHPQWKGVGCDILNLLPTKRGLGYHGTVDGINVTSWGGSVLLGDDGVYHMYAAEIVNHCGMNVWLSNSQVIHATSPDPTTTPFTRKSVVSPVFSHEPIAARAPTGEFVVFFTAVLPPTPPPVKGGKVCTGCHNGNSVPTCGTDGNRNWTDPLPTYFVYSKNPDGPWSKPTILPPRTTPVDLNFAPVIKPDGSLIALSRGTVTTAKNWRDPATYNTSASTWTDLGEDPYIWLDAQGVFHNIIHVNRVNTHGMHYFSRDGLSWNPSPTGGYAFTNVITHPDGTSTTYACRERPHVVQNKNLDIVALTNGAAEIACHDTSKPDYSYTSLQIVGQQ